MFNKKETKEENRVIPYHSVPSIERAIEVLNDALINGQLPYQRYTNATMVLVAISRDYQPRNGPSYVVNKADIISREEILKAQRQQKLQELENLKKTHTKTLEEIEKLARELGMTKV